MTMRVVPLLSHISENYRSNICILRVWFSNMTECAQRKKMKNINNKSVYVISNRTTLLWFSVSSVRKLKKPLTYIIFLFRLYHETSQQYS